MFGTPEWDAAAAAYASTPTGRVELASSLAASEAAGDVRSAVAFEHAIAEGQRLREKAELFRDGLTQYTPPAPTPEPEVDRWLDVAEDEDEDEDEEFQYVGGRAYADEDSWDDSPYRDWSPSMAGERWDRRDPVFAGCQESMSSNEFINQVCENTGITRDEFEAAAAEYLAQNAVPLALPDTGRTVGAAPVVGESLSRSQLRTLIAGSAVPRFTAAEIKTIAEMAQARREAEPQGEDPSETPGAATAAAGRSTRRSMPEVPDDPAALAALADGNDALVRQAVAGHANTPAEVLARLSTRDPKVEVRAAAARNENLPTETLVGLVGDRSIKVRAGAARNPGMPVEHLETLAEDGNDNVMGAVARNPSTPPALYARLAAHESGTVRKHAARRADIPTEIAERLTLDPEQQVRSTLARNRSTGAAVLRGLATDEAQSVRAAAAKNPNLPAPLLRGRLSRDPAPGVRAAVARNERTSVAVLTRLSSDSDPWVRRNVAWNSTTPATLLYLLARDPDEGVRSSARDRTGGGAQDAASA